MNMKSRKHLHLQSPQDETIVIDLSETVVYERRHWRTVWLSGRRN